MQHIRQLAVEIGTRPAGSDAERDAASYIAGVLTDAGYETSIDEFDFEAPRDNSSVAAPGGVYLRALALRGAPNAEATGVLVHVGIGEPADLADVDLAGRVVLFDRGVITFRDKALAAQAGGAVAAIVVNNEDTLFLGDVGERNGQGELGITIPVLAVSGEDRDALLAAQATPVTVQADAGMESATSQNVVGRQGDRCHAYLGAHYDSVPNGPGANDNASGVAVVLEVARVQRVPGLCIVLFGAEELGLIGSRHYVATNLAGTARFMLNVDMAGRLDDPQVVGDESLIELVLAATPGSGLRAGVMPPFASSDHVSFASVGVPAVTFHSGEDDALHTPRDTIERIDEAAVALFLAALDATVQDLVEQHAEAFTR